MKKQLYEQPTLLTFVVRCGGCVCTSPWGDANQAGKGLGEDDDYTYDY